MTLEREDFFLIMLIYNALDKEFVLAKFTMHSKTRTSRTHRGCTKSWKNEETEEYNLSWMH
jgi:hypothetical protein